MRDKSHANDRVVTKCDWDGNRKDALEPKPNIPHPCMDNITNHEGYKNLHPTWYLSKDIRRILCPRNMRYNNFIKFMNGLLSSIFTNIYMSHPLYASCVWPITSSTPVIIANRGSHIQNKQIQLCTIMW